jgi:hypothetical protein
MVEVILNCSDANYVESEDSELVSHWISEIFSVDPALHHKLRRPRNRLNSDLIVKQTNIVTLLIALNRRGFLRLSPLSVASISGGISPHAVTDIINQSLLGRDLLDKLEKSDTISFLRLKDNKENAANVERKIRIAVAGIALGSSGANSLEDVKVEELIAWLGFFFDESLQRYKKDLWPTDFDTSNQALRNLSAFFCQYYSDARFERFTKNRRAAVGGEIRTDRYTAAADPRFQKWLELHREWSKTHPALSRKSGRAFQHFLSYIENIVTGEHRFDPSDFMSSKPEGKTLLQYMRAKRARANLNELSNDVLSTLRFTKRLCDFYRVRKSEDFRDKPFYEIVSDAQIRFVTNEIAKQISTSSIPQTIGPSFPSHLAQILMEILDEGEQGWPGRQRECRVVHGEQEIYCPLYVAFYQFRLEIPLRAEQTRRLDSGEGDLLRYDGNTNTWETNTGTSAGYWMQRNSVSTSRGYAREIGTPPVTGFFVNTNKNGKPYVVPWQHDKAHRVLYELRLWQERFNPTRSPIKPETYVKDSEYAHDDALASLPEIFSLFRLPRINSRPTTGSPPSYQKLYKFWQKLMKEVEKRYNIQNPAFTISIMKPGVGKHEVHNAVCIYTPHSLRSLTITQLFENGVSLEIISKFVSGHSLLMAFRYLKLEPAKLHATLEAARNRPLHDGLALNAPIGGPSDQQFVEILSALNQENLDAVIGLNNSARLLWTDVEIGFCPWQGMRCGDGGRLMRREFQNGRDKSTYGPVPGGRRTCILCRHFISGPDWAFALQGYGFKLTRDFAKLSKAYNSIQDEANAIRLRNRLPGAAPEQKNADLKLLTWLDTTMEQMIRDQEQLAQALHNTEKLLTNIFEVIRKEEGVDQSIEGRALVTQGTSSIHEWIEVSSFEHSAIVATYGRFYPSLDDGDAEAACSDHIDRLLHESGMETIRFMKISASQRKEAVHALIRMLLERSTRDELYALESGNLRLVDLEYAAEIRPAIASAVGEALPLKKA